MEHSTDAAIAPSRPKASTRCRRSPSCSAPGSARSPTKRRTRSPSPTPKFPAFPCHRRRPRRAARRRRDRGPAGRAVPGTRPLLRARRRRRDARRDRDVHAARRRDAVPHQRRRRPQHGMGAAGAGRDHRPHQFRRRQSADRPCRRRPFRAADPRLRPGAAASAARGGARRPASSCTRASTCGSPARASRRRPKSAPREILGADLVGMSTVPEVILARLRGPALRRRLGRHQFRRRASPAATRATRRRRNSRAQRLAERVHASCCARLHPPRQGARAAP